MDSLNESSRAIPSSPKAAKRLAVCAPTCDLVSTLCPVLVMYILTRLGLELLVRGSETSAMQAMHHQLVVRHDERQRVSWASITSGALSRTSSAAAAPTRLSSSAIASSTRCRSNSSLARSLRAARRASADCAAARVSLYGCHRLPSAGRSANLSEVWTAATHPGGSPTPENPLSWALRRA
eukprot:scaffold282915_cov28-Tisochrysis_lutea.AAC.5